MDTINLLILVLQILIPIAGLARITYCLIGRAANQEEARSYNVRILNVIIFIVLAEIICGLLPFIASYF